MIQVKVREVDISKAVDISNRVPEFDAEYTEAFYKSRIRGKKSLIIGGFIGGQLAGAIVGYDRYNDGSFYCWMVGVDPKFRGKGVLKAMMNHFEKWAKDAGYGSIKLKTRNSRREMLSYLIKYGYNFLAVEKKEQVEDFKILVEKEIV